MTHIKSSSLLTRTLLCGKNNEENVMAIAQSGPHCRRSSPVSVSLRSKRFRGVWEQRMGFLVFCPRGKWGERANNEIWGRGRGRKETLADKPLPSPFFYSLHFRAAILCSRTPQKRLLRRLGICRMKRPGVFLLPQVGYALACTAPLQRKLPRDKSRLTRREL